MEIPIELCKSAHVYKQDPIRRGIIIVILVILYAVSVPYCYMTAGEPRRIAMQQAQKLADEKWALESASLAANDTNTNSTDFISTIINLDSEDDSSFGSDVSVSFDGTVLLGASVTPEALDEDIHDEFNDDAHNGAFGRNSNGNANGNGDLSSNPAGTSFNEGGSSGSGGGGGMSFLAGYFGPSKEQRRAKADFEKWQKEFKERSGETVSLPPEYLPSAWACLALFGTLTVHALFHLLCHWIVGFKAASLFQPAKKVEEGCFVLVVPPPNRGSAALVPVHVPSIGVGGAGKGRGKGGAGNSVARSGKSAGGGGAADGGATGLQIEFQRQKYKYVPAAKLGDAAAKKFQYGVFALTAYPVALPLSHYLKASGIQSEGDVARLIADWGKNHLAVAIPSFLDMLQAQLLSPLAIFQVFCALLWLLDEYWSYTVFTLVSVVIFEATTVFQRSRTQKMLGGMAPRPSPIYVFRCDRWVVVTTKDLLPGDLISLSYKKRAPRRGKPLAAVTATAAAAGAAAASGGGGSGAGTVTTSSKRRKSKTDGVGSGGGDSAAAGEEESKGKPISATSMDEIIPCDCLLLRGSAVVNEASLTGESVPQMKEALVAGATASSGASAGDGSSSGISGDAVSDDEERLDMSGLNRVNTLFSGCSMVTVDGSRDSSRGSDGSSSSNQSNALSHVPTPPDGGALAYVLRTGFGSSQGSLLQMIEFSQQSVAGDARETGMALLLLFLFALMASGYVLKEGLRKQEKTQHELLLKCVIIITSVVPRQFPMQMAMAVNMALMALNKVGIFCTEPYRVPLAGKVSHCLFDKTGTLTTDQLVPVGIINVDADVSAASLTPSATSSASATTSEQHKKAGGGGVSPLPELNPVITASAQTAMILAACHSLVVVDDPAATPGTAEAGSDGIEGTEDEFTSASATAEHASNANIVGDPIELAAIKAIDWAWNAKTSTASPDAGVKRNELAIRIATQQLQRLESMPAAERPQPAATFNSRVEGLRRELGTLQRKLTEARAKAAEAMYGAVQVLQRHHFSSKLQRMSVVCRCADAPSSLPGTNAGGAGGEGRDSWYCFVKGSPEALKALMKPSAIPAWYSDCYESMARRGLRVLALAYKKVSAADRPDQQPRSWVESDLQFGGLIAFECKIRADSAVVMKALIQSDHRVAMLTGDALLTSLHVAKQTGICRAGRPTLTLTLDSSQLTASSAAGAGSSSKRAVTVSLLSWSLRDEETGETSSLPFDVDSVPKLAESHNLLSTEASFMAAIEATKRQCVQGAKTTISAAAADGKEEKLGDVSPLWNYAQYFCVFARMSPQGKASVIQSIQDVNPDFHVFMCGDGGNDVGALKQADIGLALLAGHANANTTEEIAADTSVKPQIMNGPSSDGTVATSKAGAGAAGKDAVSAEDALNLHQRKMQLRQEAVNKARQAHMKEWQKQYTARQQAELQEEIARRTEAGDYMALFNVMKDQASKAKQAVNEENARFMRMHGQVWDPKKDGGDGDGAGKTGIEKMLESMDSGDAGGLPMVRPGDASVAAPFTSRIPSVRAVVDLIRQGRCTLLSALMQQQIMMLESTIAAYTLSALSLHNARSSERQMMASSWLIMTAAVSFSYASPLDHMHPLRPLRSLFHPAIILSTLGQAAIHIACMTLAVQWATDAMGPEALKEVTEFFKKAKANEVARDAHCGEDDFMCQMQAYWTAPFMPNLLNSVVFLVETSQMISVFFANYKGRPWMKGMLENHPLFLSVFACIGGVVVASWEMVPQLNDMLQLAPFPDDYFRYKVVLLVVATILGTFMWDRLCVMLFAPQVFKASLGEAGKTSFKDFLPIFMTLGKVVAAVALLGTGNILLIGGAIWWYRSYTLKQKEQEAKKLGL